MIIKIESLEPDEVDYITAWLAEQGCWYEVEDED